MNALIPARGGSKSIPKKNIIDLCGHPLIAYPIVHGKRAGLDVYVSTDDGEIADVARGYGAKIIDRPSELAQDNSGDLEVFRHAVESQKWSNTLPVVHLRATTPMVHSTVIKEAISTTSNFHTSLRSAHETPESAYKYFTIKDGNFEGLMGTGHDLPRQLVPKTYKPNGYVDIVRPDWFMIAGATLHGPRIYPFITPVTPEVDSMEELEYIAWLMSKNHDYYRI
jgi:CMP-N,N'-diacetyllegionaminic acid synthase